MAVEWLPLVFQRQELWFWTVFYFIVEIGSRVIARKLYGNDDKKRDIFGRYLPSLVHALLHACWPLFPDSFGGPWGMVYGNMSGYFVADSIVDRDPEYLIHHIAPLIHFEIMLRLGCTSVLSTSAAIYIVEVGNVLSHGAAIFFWRQGLTYHRFNYFSFLASRTISIPFGFGSWYFDVPVSKRFSIPGLMVLALSTTHYFINFRWIWKMYSHGKWRSSYVPREQRQRDETLKARSGVKKEH